MSRGTVRVSTACDVVDDCRSSAPRAGVEERSSLRSMRSVPTNELGGRIGDALRQLHAGGSLSVTVAGRPVAGSHPAPRTRRAGEPALDVLGETPAPVDSGSDLERPGGGAVHRYDS